MAQIVIEVSNKKKAQLLLELLRSLDFIERITAHEEVSTMETKSDDDFFALAGIWEGRDINLEDIRQKAWPART